MEFVGRTVKKEFHGVGVFTGVVHSYDESSKFFEIVYEDGDSEEMDLSEVASLLDKDRVWKENESDPVHVKPRLGRKPKKRPRVERNRGGFREESGKLDETLEKECCGVNANLVDGFVDLNDGVFESLRGSDSVNCKFSRNVELEGIPEKGCEVVGDLREMGSVNGNLMVDVEIKEGFDLNAGFNFNLNDDNVEGNDNMSLQKLKRQCIDLNLDANGEMEENLEIAETQKRECGFDLNLGVDDESKDDKDGDCARQVKEFASLHKVEEVVANGALKEVIVTQDFGLELVDSVRKEESVSIKDLKARDDTDGVRFKEELTTSGIEATDGCGGDEGSSYKRVSGRRKKRKVVHNVNSLNEMVLRRSTRRGSARNNVLSSTSCVVNDISSSSAAGLLMEELPVLSTGERVQEPVILPPKLQLPPSSQNLDLDGIPVLDVFSIYACLRSFSTLLFLSPFELEDFVTALKCQSSNSLFDCIHVSILHTLRKHLEHLSKEGSESASNCLRSLNWGLLDSVTWPVFMIEYLMIHSSGLKPGFELSQLKLFKSEYYKQPVSVKVEMLRCLCDDMIEVEAIRLELNRRSSAAEPDMDFDRNTNNEVGKKRRVVMDMSAASCLTEEVVDDANDWNSDECFLCKMDGNLLCCDGCPAAYHSKCVGVANDLLPEGDWFCPECAIDRGKPCVKPSKLLRGAELLGVDHHGRLYFSSCGYLLVSNSCDTECTFSFYHRNELNVVIDVLKSSDTFYGGIINAICQEWDITVGLNGVSNLDSLNAEYSDMHTKAERPAISMPSASLVSSETHAVMSETVKEGKPEGNFLSGYSCHLDSDVPKSVSILDSVTTMEMPNISSEGSAETTEMRATFQNFQKHCPKYSNRAAKFSNQSEVPRKLPTFGDSSMTSTCSDINQKVKSSTSSVINTRLGGRSQVQCDIAYVNCYGFAQTASSIAEELHKFPNEIKELSIKSEEEMISTQMKAILKKWDKFCWPNIQDLNVDIQREKCGWCFSCKAPAVEADCLFNMNNGSVFGRLESEVVGFQSKRNKKGHLIDVICHILSIEDRLRGLLLGPWLNPHYSKLWRKNSLKTADVTSAKQLLLTLESNLHHLAISAEWLKLVDSVVTIGSASHIVINSSRAKNGVSRKRGRYLDFESKPSSNASGGLRIYWWRGGRVSRQLFNWKVLPHSLVSKAARQAGRMKIPGILYPESSDFAKRSRNVAWRAAVESSATVEQLAIQVREFDSNIRWNDIENTHPLCAMDKEFRKSSRLFKKAIVRRKCLKEGEGVKYLVDFGKRRSVPDIVVKHGSKVEDSSSEKKKYWLSESYVPLHLLKGFEERRLARKSSKLTSGKLLEANKVMKKSSRKKGFSYLFSKAERSEYYQCVHCKKDVLIREAVCCQYCEGYFHKRHIKKSAGATISDCKYTCYRCQNGEYSKTDTRTAKGNKIKGKISTRSSKVQSQKLKKATTVGKSVQLKNNKKSVRGRRPVQSQNKNIPAVPLRRSTRKVKFVLAQNKNTGGRKKGKQKTKKKTSKKPKKEPRKGTSWRKKRTQACYSYWLNGLLLSRKPNDERVMQFRTKKFFASSEHLTIVLDQPKCCLCCESGCMLTSDYIACEICGEWYHGDAYGLNAENICMLIGFRCHVCRKRTPPVCPHRISVGSVGSHLVETQDNVKIGCAEEVCIPVLPPSELKSEQQSHINEDLEGLFPVVQNADSIHISSKDLKPDMLTACNETVLLEDNTVRELSDVPVVLHDQLEPPSCKVNGDLMDTESALLQHEKEKDGLVKKTATLSPLDSIELPSQTYMASDEVLDEEKTV
ncbi:hypothetical protein ACOSQ4_017137 [Xanthoceras sorbifolium]